MNFARLFVIALATSPPLALAACSYPDFQFDPLGAGSVAHSAAAAGSTGAGGAKSSSATHSHASSSASSTGSTGSGGASCDVTHPGGGTCEYLPTKQCGCPPSQKCAVTDPATGSASCIDHAATPAFSKCTDDSDCAADTWCDPITFACRPICRNVGDCALVAPGAQCNAAMSASHQKIPGLKVCTAHCDPSLATPCGPNLTCSYDTNLSEFDCYVSLKKVLGTTCKYLNDCDKGLVCVGSAGTAKCALWCHPADGSPNIDCPFDQGFCKGVDIAVQYNGSTYGICTP